MSNQVFFMTVCDAHSVVIQTWSIRCFFIIQCVCVCVCVCIYIGAVICLGVVQRAFSMMALGGEVAWGWILLNVLIRGGARLQWGVYFEGLRPRSPQPKTLLF